MQSVVEVRISERLAEHADAGDVERLSRKSAKDLEAALGAERAALTEATTKLEVARSSAEAQHLELEELQNKLAAGEDVGSKLDNKHRRLEQLRGAVAGHERNVARVSSAAQRAMAQLEPALAIARYREQAEPLDRRLLESLRAVAESAARTKALQIDHAAIAEERAEIERAFTGNHHVTAGFCPVFVDDATFMAFRESWPAYGFRCDLDTSGRWVVSKA